MTGLVYLAIIALWAVFLIPWLGRHRDEHNGRRTADRYHRAMDTLARGSRVRREADGHAEQDSEYSDDDVELLDSQAVEDDLATGPSMPDPLAAVGLVLGTLRGRERGGLAARRRPEHPAAADPHRPYTRSATGCMAPAIATNIRFSQRDWLNSQFDFCNSSTASSSRTTPDRTRTSC